tara:strand:+ start:472 stop:675 length:204 start_codon:yes stop_codon:yes gene_type:complete
MNTEPETIDITPTWAATAEMLLLIIKDGTNFENKQWAESEVLRMGRIIDQLKQREAEFSAWVASSTS